MGGRACTCCTCGPAGRPRGDAGSCTHRGLPHTVPLRRPCSSTAWCHRPTAPGTARGWKGRPARVQSPTRTLPRDPQSLPTLTPGHPGGPAHGPWGVLNRPLPRSGAGQPSMQPAPPRGPNARCTCHAPPLAAARGLAGPWTGLLGLSHGPQPCRARGWTPLYSRWALCQPGVPTLSSPVAQLERDRCHLPGPSLTRISNLDLTPN